MNRGPLSSSVHGVTRVRHNQGTNTLTFLENLA